MSNTAEPVASSKIKIAVRPFRRTPFFMAAFVAIVASAFAILQLDEQGSADESASDDNGPVCHLTILDSPQSTSEVVPCTEVGKRAVHKVVWP